MRKHSALLLLSAAGLLAILSSTASKSPMLPLFAEYLGAGPSEIGLIAAASTIIGIVVNVTAGTLSDVYGKRKPLILSGFFFATRNKALLEKNSFKHHNNICRGI